MTPLTKIEQGVIKGDWNLVCEGFNKLTGKKISPPATKTEPAKFVIKGAAKVALYKYLSDKIDLEPMKSYTKADLVEMASVHAMSEDFTEEIVDNTYPEPPPKNTTPLKSGKFLDGFRYHSGRKELLPMDNTKLSKFTDPQLKNVGDPEKEYVPRDPPKKVNYKCMKCSKSFKGLSSLGVMVDGETKALCTVCSETV